MKNNLSDVQKNFIVNLSEKEGSLFKKTLLCRTGTFNGMYGPITVSKELLEKLAAHYNNQRENPQNENDYAPILLDHIRNVDTIKGRLMTGLSVSEWVNPENGQSEWGLYGDLRVDTPDAIEKVEQGIYSQVSLSFDEETGEIFEVSFVAVEAARRSQVLSKGEKAMDFETKFKALSTTHDELVGRVNALKAVSTASCQSLSQHVEQVTTEAKEVESMIGKIKLSLKTASLAGQFKGFVKQGKISLAEFKGIKVAELAALPKEALSAVLAAYESRPVNKDFIQHGQADAKPVALEAKTPEQMRELIKLQREGKTLQSLAEGEQPEEKKEDEQKAAAAEGGKPEEKKEGDSELKLEDIDEAMKYLDGMSPMIEKVSSSMKKMSDIVKKLMESSEDKKEEKKEGENE